MKITIGKSDVILAVELIVDEMQKINKKKHYHKSFDQNKKIGIKERDELKKIFKRFYLFKSGEVN